MASSTLAVADFETEAPNTAMAETRAMPIMSAEAVWAVRRGLRIEFNRPSFPAAPNARASGRPIAADNGRATAGASMATPKRTSRAATATSNTFGSVSPMASTTPPIMLTAAPRMSWRRGVTSVSAWRSTERCHWGYAHGPAGRADRGNDGDADADGEGNEHSSGLEHERA